VGIIGPNGSGKSTLLKLITRILEPSSRVVRVRGRISALLELGAGFHPDLTGRENVYLNGSLLGYSSQEMDRQYESIVRFAELERFMDMPVKHYSSGMYMRLGFSIAIHVDPDILLIDEVLAVGDRAFQQKCLERIQSFRRGGKTIVFVSHDLEAVRTLCDRVVWLDDGVIRMEGPTMDVVAAYLDSTWSQELARLQASRQALGGEGRWGSMQAEILDVRFYDHQGQERQAFCTGDTFVARITYDAHDRIERPMFGVAIHNDQGVHISGPNTVFSDYPIPWIEGRGTIDYIIESLPLLEGTYFFSAAIYDHTGTHPYDHHQLKYVFRVRPGRVKERYGVFYIPSRWVWQPETSADDTAAVPAQDRQREGP
jgi:lipopolysaccharide transport system ATP-binding protein